MIYGHTLKLFKKVVVCLAGSDIPNHDPLGDLLMTLKKRNN